MVVARCSRELGVAELIGGARLAEYASVVGVFEKALWVPWQAAGEW